MDLESYAKFSTAICLGFNSAAAPLLQVHLPFGQINCCQMQEIDGILDLAVWLPLLHFHFIHLPLLF